MQKEVINCSNASKVTMNLTSDDINSISISPRLIILNKIKGLENLQTPRRIRDSLLGTDNGWMADLEKQIAEFRSQLEAL